MEDLILRGAAENRHSELLTAQSCRDQQPSETGSRDPAPSRVALWCPVQAGIRQWQCLCQLLGSSITRGQNYQQSYALLIHDFHLN